MWSPRYNRWWGCRCCRPANGRKLHVNGNWELWAGGSYTPPPPPPPTPSPTGFPTKAGAKPPRLVKDKYGCARQLGMICKTCTAAVCVQQADRNGRCASGDGSVMWSPRYNKWWGCRCCAKPNGRALKPNGNWQLWGGSRYTVPAAPPPLAANKAGAGGTMKRKYPGKGCGSQIRYLGKTFRTPKQCFDKFLWWCKRYKNNSTWKAACVSPEIMWAPRYNRWWGCRGCYKSTRYHSNRNWDLYGY